jgi:hypothetical protein
MVLLGVYVLTKATELLSMEAEYYDLGTVYIFRTEGGTVVGWWRKPVIPRKPLTIREHLSLLTTTQRVWLAATLVFLIATIHFGVLVDALLALFWIGGTLAMLGSDVERGNSAKKTPKPEPARLPEP